MVGRLRFVLIAGVLLSRVANAFGEEPAKQPSADANTSTVSADVQYAQARLDLAQVNLARMEKMNAKVANVVSNNVVNAYRNDVTLAKLQLEEAQAGKSDSFRVWLLDVESQYQAAETAYKSAQAANKRKAGTFDPLDVERMRLRTEVIRLNLDRGRALADQPREAQLAWRVSTLNDEIERLMEVVFRNSTSRSSTPSMWYYYVPW